jgi:predicted ribosome quality control (RQC) complex YloA/Tae2 family protein
MRVPFDSLCLSAVVDECQRLVGGRVQRVSQWDPFTVGLGVYRGKEEWLLLSCDPRYFRAHLLARRPDSPKEPPSFCMALRKHLDEARVEFVRQRGLDRVMDIGVSSASGDLQIVVELMGKHSNLVLVDGERKVLAAAKVVGPSKSRRPILPGREYLPPPFEARPSLLDASEGDDLSGYEGASPFLRKLIEAGVPLSLVQSAVRERAWSPSYAEGHGGYPLPLATLFANAVPREVVSQAIEQAYTGFIERDAVESARSSLLSQLTRVLVARNRALDDIEQALDAAARARERQEMGELILAYQRQVQPGDKELTVPGYDGEPRTIALDPTKTAVENAQRLFAKARRAKEGAEEVRGQKRRLDEDRAELLRTLDAVKGAENLAAIEAAKATADKRRWLHAPVVARYKEDRPYEGHSVRELVSPGGWKVLYGENATSNDYLTTKVARPNDLWFHVRGVTSAHVVLLTQNQPQRVQKEDLLFAAKVAVSKSASKHSSYVTVDYTLKKHVRKPRKSAPGFVTYSQEKTLHIEP